MRNREDATLRFLHDPEVPWSNNQAEQDLRPAKTLIKIIGGLRTEDGAQDFCMVRSYLSTTAKNGIHPFDAISDGLASWPWLPTAHAADGIVKDPVAGYGRRA